MPRDEEKAEEKAEEEVCSGEPIAATPGLLSIQFSKSYLPKNNKGPTAVTCCHCGHP
jgi:hypothetical protein